MRITTINGIKFTGWTAAGGTYISAIPETEDDALVAASALEGLGFDVKITPHVYSDGAVGFYNVDATASGDALARLDG